MPAKNCRRCGAFMNGPGYVCPDCILGAEEHFETVRQYLMDNPHADLRTVACETGVNERDILQFLREGRLVAQSLALAELRCERCGAPVDRGKLCPACAGSLSKQLKDEAHRPSKTGTGQRGGDALWNPSDGSRSGSAMHSDRRLKERRDGGRRR